MLLRGQLTLRVSFGGAFKPQQLEAAPHRRRHLSPAVPRAGASLPLSQHLSGDPAPSWPLLSRPVLPVPWPAGARLWDEVAPAAPPCRCGLHSVRSGPCSGRTVSKIKDRPGTLPPPQERCAGWGTSVGFAELAPHSHTSPHGQAAPGTPTWGSACAGHSAHAGRSAAAGAGAGQCGGPWPCGALGVQEAGGGAELTWASQPAPASS